MIGFQSLTTENFCPVPTPLVQELPDSLANGILAFPVGPDAVADAVEAKANRVLQLRNVLADPSFVDHMTGVLQTQIDRIRAMRDPKRNGCEWTKKKYHFWRSIGLVTSDGLVISGAQNFNENPPSCNLDEETALALLHTTGRLQDVVGYFVLDECRSRNAVFVGRANDLLHYHMHPAFNDMVVLDLPSRWGKANELDVDVLSAYPPTKYRRGCQRPVLTLREPQPFYVLYETDQQFDLDEYFTSGRTDAHKEFALLICDELLGPGFGNTTSDLVPPASKGHIACGKLGNQLLIVVNRRVPEFSAECCCAEFNLSAAAWSLGWTHFDAVFTFSNHYQANGGDALMTPTNCRVCVGALAERLHPEHNNIALINANGVGDVDFTNFIDAQTRCYSSATHAVKSGQYRKI